MKKLLQRMKEAFIRSTKRFPEVILWGLLMTLVAMLLNHDVGEEDTYGKILLGLAFGLPYLAAYVLWWEKRTLPKVTRFIGVGAALLAAVVVYFITPDHPQGLFIQRMFALIASGYIVFTLVPFKWKQAGYTKYMLYLILHFSVTMIFSLIVFLGLGGILLSLDQLFNVTIESELYFDMFLLAAGLFAVPFFLGHIPKDDQMETYTAPAPLKILAEYILVPLFTIYTVILYAYFLRVLISFSFPEGTVANLVLWYGLLSILTYALLTTVEQKTMANVYFRRYFPLTMIVPLGMMFAALWIRIDYYGLTIERYMALVGGLYIALTYGQLVLKRSAYYKGISYGVILFLLVASFGPFHMEKVVYENQAGRVTQVLKENQMLVNNQLLPRETSDLSSQDQEIIASGVRYLVYQDQVDRLSYLPEDFSLSDFELYFGFAMDRGFDPLNEPYVNLSFYEEFGVGTIEEGKYLIDFRFYNRQSGQDQGWTYDFGQDKILVLTSPQQEQLSFDFKAIGDSFDLTKGRSQGVKMEDLSYSFSQGGYTGTFFFTNISGRMTGGELKYDNFEGTIYLEAQ